MAANDRAERLLAVFQAQRRRLWGLAYRMTGTAEDADEIVQESFARLAARHPTPDDAHVGPWLVRVATNLGIDALRRRRRRAYVGAWLPAPIETAEIDEHADPEARYGLGESLTFAFLLALEALSPRQRAVLLLRDVLGHSARETAALLEVSEGNVRVLHTRARAALADYDESRCIPSPALREHHRAALQQLLACLVAQDSAGLAALLAESVATVTDSAGEYTALAVPLSGRARVVRFYLTAARNRRDGLPRFAVRIVNGLPAILVSLSRVVRRQAMRTLIRVDLDDDGRIRAIHSVLASAKLSALRWE